MHDFNNEIFNKACDISFMACCKKFHRCIRVCETDVYVKVNSLACSVPRRSDLKWKNTASMKPVVMGRASG